MSRPTPTPPKRGLDKAPLLGGVGVGSESPCAREVWGGLSLRGTKFRPVLIRRAALPALLHSELSIDESFTLEDDAN